MMIRIREIPVPIPNTKVKSNSVDDTLLETIGESRRLPAKKESGGLIAQPVRAHA